MGSPGSSSKAPAQYARAFLYTETDDLDSTYFVLHQLAVVRRAIDELYAYALRYPDTDFTYRSHATSHRVALESARLDLLELERRGSVKRRKAGRQFAFRPDPDLADPLAVTDGSSGQIGARRT